jgi:glycine/D-amino acid oxidase-like deaminating enzyme
VNLRTTQPWWLLRNGLLHDYPPLEHDIDCDVAVVGGGLTGALIADRLSRAGMSLTVIDSRSIGEGSTAASTALLQYEVDQPLRQLSKSIGLEAAVRVYRLGSAAIDALEVLSREIACRFARRPSLQLASRPTHSPRLQHECGLRQQHGFACHYLGRHELVQRYGFDHAGALFTEVAGELDPYRLTHGLLRRALGRGVRVFDRTLVTSYRSQGDTVTLSTDRSHDVRAKRVIFATGYEALEFGPRRLTTLKSTFAIVTDPIPDLSRWPDRCLIWETSLPYLYLRTTDDQRIIVGGGDIDGADPLVRDRLLPRKANWLEGRLRRLLPWLTFDIAFAWAGAFAETADSLPMIGPARGFPNAHFALGYGGNGVTFAAIAADVLCGLMTDGDHIDAALFSPDRVAPRK